MSLLKGIKKKLRPFYYRHFEFFHLVRALEWNIMSKWLKPTRGEVILDIGCGHGHFVRRAWRPGLRIFGVDLNESGIGIGQRYNCPSGCGFALADAMHLPFRNEVFGKVMSVCALEHFSDDEEAIREVNRVLKKDGEFVLSVDSLNYRGITTSYKEKCKEKHFVYRFYTNELLKNKLERLGFRDVGEKYAISSPVSSLGYKSGTFFRWRGIDFMDPVIFVLLFPFSYLIENIFGLGFDQEGYLLVAKAIKAVDQI